MTLEVIEADMLDALPKLAADGVQFHSVVTDPPYHLTSGNAAVDWDAFTAPSTAGQGRSVAGGLKGPTNPKGRGFMGKQWDGGDIAFRPETWRAVYDVMLPGAYLVAFASTRGYHRMVCAIEDAGFIIHPMLAWIFGSGFPKAQDASKAIDRQLGAVREVIGTVRAGIGRNNRHGGEIVGGECDEVGKQVAITAPATPEAAAWDGWKYGLQSLKPAIEPICLAQRPMKGTGAANLLRHGCGALNVDASRIGTEARFNPSAAHNEIYGQFKGAETEGRETNGRYPANVIHDGSPEVLDAFAAFGERGSFVTDRATPKQHNKTSYGLPGVVGESVGFGDTGTAARFFYSAKADAADRADSRHPTVKPVDLIRYLVTLVTPKCGRVLDPFAGSGTTGEACMLLGHDCTMIERDATHAADIRHRIRRWSGLDAPLFADAAN